MWESKMTFEEGRWTGHAVNMWQTAQVTNSAPVWQRKQTRGKSTNSFSNGNMGRSNASPNSCMNPQRICKETPLKACYCRNEIQIQNTALKLGMAWYDWHLAITAYCRRFEWICCSRRKPFAIKTDMCWYPSNPISITTESHIPTFPRHPTNNTL